MPAVEIASARIVEGSDIWISARLQKADGTDVLVSDVDSWSVYVYDNGVLQYSSENNTPQVLGAGGTFSNAVLGPDGYSDEKYNFRHRILGGSWAMLGGHTYRIEYEITTVQFGSMHILADVRVVSVHHE